MSRGGSRRGHERESWSRHIYLPAYLPAMQLARFTAKSVRRDVGGDDDVNKIRLHGSLDDPSAWAELMSVVARVCA